MDKGLWKFDILEGMKPMLRNILGISFLGMFLFVFGFDLVQAQDLADVQQASGVGDASLGQIIGNIIRVFLSVAGVILLALIIYAGVLWMTAGGNAEKVAKAKQTMIRAVIGLLIIMSSLAITTFIMNALGLSTGFGGGQGNFGDNGFNAPPFSNSLGNGGIVDHYPFRNETDVPRNAKIMVTFKNKVDFDQLVDGNYSEQGTPLNIYDDTLGGDPIFVDGQPVIELPINDRIVDLYPTANDSASLIDQTNISFSEDGRTIVLFPPVLGSDTEDVSYTVELSGNLDDSNGNALIDSDGYIWSFETGTVLDLTPPRVVSSFPAAGSTYDRNVAVQIVFNEPLLATSASGIRRTLAELTELGLPANLNFDNIEVGSGTVLTPGQFTLSNGYRIVSFKSSQPCGDNSVNSCGEAVFCLPGSARIDVLAKTAATDSTGVQALNIANPRGVLDVAGNVLDGDGDGTSEGSPVDDYTYSFNTSNNIELTPPVIEDVFPDFNAQEIDFDATIGAKFDEPLLASSVTSENVDLLPRPLHELWFRPLLSTPEGASNADRLSLVDVDHGIFLASTADVNFNYALRFNEGIKDAYFNCFVPAAGIGNSGQCVPTEESPYCCNGNLQATECTP